MKLHDSQLDAVYKAYYECRNVHRVAKVFGVTGETIRQFLLKHGCKIHKSHWTAGEEQAIRDYYASTSPNTFSLKRLARMLGRPYYGVAMKASKMGLGNHSRPKAEKLGITQPTLPWGKWVKYPHPRGMAGKKHSDEVKRKASAGSRAYWEQCKRTNTGHMSPEHLQKSSDRMSKLNVANILAGKSTYSRCKHGRRPDLGEHFFRSKWEANYARYLNFLQSQGKILKWDYEVDTFWFEAIRRGVRSYTPDFKVWTSPDTFHYEEVKGWMDKKSKTKLKRMKKYHPMVKVVVIDEKRYQGIARTAKGIVKNWE